MLTFEVNDELLHAVIETFWNIAGLNFRVNCGGSFRLFSKKRDSSDFADDYAW